MGFELNDEQASLSVLENYVYYQRTAGEDWSVDQDESGQICLTKEEDVEYYLSAIAALESNAEEIADMARSAYAMDADSVHIDRNGQKVEGWETYFTLTFEDMEYLGVTDAVNRHQLPKMDKEFASATLRHALDHRYKFFPNDCSKLYGYMHQKGIDPEILDSLIQTKHLMQSTDPYGREGYVFVGTDGDKVNCAKFVSFNDQKGFSGDLLGSDYRKGGWLVDDLSQDKAGILVICETPIDMISYMGILKESGQQDFRSVTYLVPGPQELKAKTISDLCKEKGIHSVHVFANEGGALTNRGREISYVGQNLLKGLEGTVKAKLYLPEGCRNWNERLNNIKRGSQVIGGKTPVRKVGFRGEAR
ncbi:hypothetical protein [Faecalibaculum rodentium]|uniref:hypothetical protein n=1 Tax=Faecalibaculum rodentium TaxID=1702221 RepID=UPI0026EF142F|nr:hypothetical protein [Faecalibaculum rodentium]